MCPRVPPAGTFLSPLEDLSPTDPASCFINLRFNSFLTPVPAIPPRALFYPPPATAFPLPPHRVSPNLGAETPKTRFKGVGKMGALSQRNLHLPTPYPPNYPEFPDSCHLPCNRVRVKREADTRQTRAYLSPNSVQGGRKGGLLQKCKRGAKEGCPHRVRGVSASRSPRVRLAFHLKAVAGEFFFFSCQTHTRDALRASQSPQKDRETAKTTQKGRKTYLARLRLEKAGE